MPEPHLDGKGQDVLAADGGQLQQPADGRQLSPGHVVQGELVLKEFGELENVLVGDGCALLLHRVVKVHEPSEEIQTWKKKTSQMKSGTKILVVFK